MTPLCPICKLPSLNGPHSASGTQCVGAQATQMRNLLGFVGDRATCSGCGAEIYWVTHRNGKKTPYDPNGLSHFVSCPKAEQFSTRKKAV